MEIFEHIQCDNKSKGIVLTTADIIKILSKEEVEE